MQTLLKVTAGVAISLAAASVAVGVFQPDLVSNRWEWVFAVALVIIALLAYELARVTTKSDGSGTRQSQGANPEQQIALLYYHAHYCEAGVQFLVAAEGQLPKPVALLRFQPSIVIIMACPLVAAYVARGLRFQVYWRPPGRLRKPRMLVGIAQVEHIQESGLLHAKVLDIANKDPLLVAVEPLHGQIGYTALAEGTWTTELELPTMPQVDVQRRG